MRLLRQLACLLFLTAPLHAQNTAQQLTLSGLLTQNNHGSFLAAKYAADGTLYLLFNQQDGIRILHADAGATTLLAQAHTGAAGDTPIAAALDPSGDLYVAGTTTSGTLTGTSGTPFPTRADTSTNSFLAKYDANLNLLWLTFLGAGRTSATALTATADAVFVTGLTYSTTFPVTASAILQTPASGSLQNGFVERFSADGATLVYATYLTGANGDTTPAAIAADTSDNAYVTGLTTASGYPTISALIPNMIGVNSGFLTGFTPAADGITFSTFLPGNGLTSLALDGATLVLTGNVSLGDFPVATVNAPLVATAYQTLLRIPIDGQSVTSSNLLLPGTTSNVAVGPAGTAWISGTLTTPLFPGTPPLSEIGDTFLVHLTAANTLDQTLRFGGLPVDNATYASLTTTPAAPAVNGVTVALPGQLTTTVAASLSATQRFDLPQIAAPNALLPNTVRDVPATCSSGQCTGTAATLSLTSTATSAPSLALSTGDLPNLTLRNLGSATATGLSLSATGYALATNCAATLDPSAQCTIALTGSGPGSITVSAANAPNTTTALPSNTLTPDPLALSAYELDFGAATSASPVSRTLTVTNLTATTQTFSSALDHPATTAYSFTETATDCAKSGTSHTLAANATCHITLTLTPSSAASNDGPAQQSWLLGTRDILLTGFAQAAAVNVSATTLDFGTQFTGANAIRLPRYLYLSNNSASPVAHTAVALPGNSPFAVTDACPSTLAAHTVCRLALNYLSPTAPADDSATLLVDATTVTVLGKTLPPQGATGSTTNPNLSVSPTTANFATAVIVTGVSGTPQTLTITNLGTTATPLTLTITGDFTDTTNCPATLAAAASCQVQISFTPSQPGTREGLLALATTNTFSPTYVALTGTATAILPANNGTLALGQTFVGEPLVAWYKLQQPLATLTATTSNPAFSVALVTDTGSGHGTLPASAFSSSVTAPCANCWLGVQFLSGSTGAQSATLELTTTTAGKPYDLTLTATALPVQGLLLSPLAQDFGSVAVHSTSAPTPFTLTNLLTPSAAVLIQSITVTGDFAVTTSNIGGAPCSGQLPATASCFLSVTFAPTATGQRTGTLTLATNNGTVTAALTGYATPDPGLALNPTALDFENISGAAATQQTLTLTNTGSTTLTLNTPTTSNAAFAATTNCATLAPAATCTIAVTFQPQASLITATLAIPLTATQNGQTSTTTYTVPLTGNYTASATGLTLLPDVANFGALATGSLGQTRQFTLTNNTAKTQALSLSMPRQFALANATNCPQLAPGASCVFSVSFLPVTNGEATGTLTATASDGTQTLAYMLGYGNGLGTLSVSSGTTLSFGQVASGQSSAKSITLTNAGTTNVTIKRVTSLPPFFSTTTCGALLAPNATCTVSLTYTPIDEIATGSSQTGTRNDTGTLTIESDAATSPTAIALNGSVTPITTSSPASPDVLASFALSESALTFANTTVGSASAAQTVQLTNTGTTTLHLTALLTPADYTATTTCATLLAAQTCTITVTFAPNSGTSTVRSGTLEILSDAATSLEFVTLFATSTPSPLTLSPTALDFGTVTLGSSGQLNVTVTNNSAAAITFLSTATTGEYAVARGTCPANSATLAAGSSCTLNVTFAPTATGTRTGTLSLTTDATPLPLTVTLTGNATTAHLQVSPGALAFGAIAVGSPASLTLTLLNAGSATVTNITPTITGPNTADFAVTVPCPVTQLAPNQGCAVTVTYTPSTTGNESAALNIASSDPASPLVVPLTGTGSAPGDFTLTVNGSSSATLTVASGSPAVYPLLLTPLNGFTGQLALTCTPISAAQYASCSLLASSLTLNGGGAQASTATINTITSMSERGGLVALFALVLFPFKRKEPSGSNKRRYAVALVFLLLLLFALALLGCGGNKPGGKLLYTPAGTYQYQVTATTTSGPQLSHTVTLNLIVQ